jgi:hypothetical protein
VFIAKQEVNTIDQAILRTNNNSSLITPVTKSNIDVLQNGLLLNQWEHG